MASWGEMFEAAAASAEDIEDFDAQYGSAPLPVQVDGGYPDRSSRGKGRGRKGTGKAGKATWQGRGVQKELGLGGQGEADLVAAVALLQKRVARMEAALEAAGIDIPGDEGSSEESEEEGLSQESEEEASPDDDSDDIDHTAVPFGASEVEPPLQSGDSFADACFQAALEQDLHSRQQTAHRKRRG